ncbi:BgiBFREP29 [Biomphalaria glabrata]|nr:BgiBFREP29 [Biomphalaria glabrata]
MAFLLSLLLGVSLSPLALSDLIFNVQPDVISPVLTSQILVNCTVTNNQVPNIDAIKSVSLSRYNETIKDFYVLLSLDTQTFNLQQFVQFRHAQVSFGNLFLSLTVYNPVQSDAQAYRCNVDGDNSVQKNVSRKAKKEVKYEPNVTALIQEITRLKISEEIGRCSSKNIGIPGDNNIRSKLHFVGNSEFVKEYIEPLTLRCSFLAANENAHQDSAVQFMYILHETSGVIATISRDQTVPTTSQNLSYVTLQGELNETISKNYLQVTWRNAKFSDSGKYRCRAYVNNVNGQRDMFQEELVVSVQRPTHDDLVKVVHELQRLVDKWKDSQQISELNIININDDLRTYNNSMMSVKEDLKNNQQKLESFGKDLTTSQQNIQSVIEDFKINQRHIETVQDDLKITKQNVESVKDDLKITKQNVETVKDDLKITKQNVESVKDDLKITKQNVETVKDDLKITKQNIENVNKDMKMNQQNMDRFKQNIESAKENRTETIQIIKYIFFFLQGKTNYTFLHELIGSLLPESCRDVFITKDRKVVTLASGLKVMCDTKTDGGGWTIFQRRINGKVDFYRGWKEYRDGFGDYNIGEFYLGNENIFSLTSTGQYDLRIDLEYNDKKYFAQFENFKVLSETEKYKLKIGNYSGNAGDMLSRHNNMFFTTFDRDNDVDSGTNCAEERSGAWWYRYCYDSNLNGLWGSTSIYKGMIWPQLTGWSKIVSFSEMKIRERK